MFSIVTAKVICKALTLHKSGSARMGGSTSSNPMIVIPGITSYEYSPHKNSSAICDSYENASKDHMTDESNDKILI